MGNQRKAIILFSGGLDSTTCLAEAMRLGRDVHLLSVHYGQRHNVELSKAVDMRKSMDIPEDKHVILHLPDLNKIAFSALTGHCEVPQEGVIFDGIPPTYVPGRNVIFLSLALAWAESLGAEEVWAGVNALDYSGYPDCRPEFTSAFEVMMQEAVKSTAVDGRRIELVTPLINLTKVEIIRMAVGLGVNIAATHSCYAPGENGEACGKCDSCLLREEGLKQVGLL